MYMQPDVLSRVSKRLAFAEPPETDLRRAAVAIMVSEDERPSTLMIVRAVRVGDPWSGQVAFPGGKAQEGESTAVETAVRETKEEVGIDLGREGRFMGYAEASTTHTGTMRVVPCVFALPVRLEVSPNAEVASHRWLELEGLLSSKAKSHYGLVMEGKTVSLPAIKVEDYVIWGLSHRIITNLFGT